MRLAESKHFLPLDIGYDDGGTAEGEQAKKRSHCMAATRCGIDRRATRVSPFTNGHMRRLLALIVALVAAGGVLAIDDETAQVVFLLGVCALALLSELLPLDRPPRDRGMDNGSDWMLIIPAAVALILAQAVFESEDAQLAALFVLGVPLAVAWRLLRVGERLRGRRPRRHTGGST